jgi:hypothetical protein
MNYGNAKTAAGGTLVLTGMTMGEQVTIVLAAILLITAVAVFMRGKWRKNKKLSDQ